MNTRLPNPSAALDTETSNLLASLWLRNRPLIEERLSQLDRAAMAAASGDLSVEMREEAADTAHKLAGSLGMYGYDQGTRLARQIELLLDYRNPDAGQLHLLTKQLRECLTFPDSVS